MRRHRWQRRAGRWQGAAHRGQGADPRRRARRGARPDPDRPAPSRPEPARGGDQPAAPPRGDPPRDRVGACPRASPRPGRHEAGADGRPRPRGLRARPRYPAGPPRDRRAPAADARSGVDRGADRGRPRRAGGLVTDPRPPRVAQGRFAARRGCARAGVVDGPDAARARSRRARRGRRARARRLARELPDRLLRATHADLRRLPPHRHRGAPPGAALALPDRSHGGPGAAADRGLARRCPRVAARYLAAPDRTCPRPRGRAWLVPRGDDQRDAHRLAPAARRRADRLGAPARVRSRRRSFPVRARGDVVRALRARHRGWWSDARLVRRGRCRGRARRPARRPLAGRDGQPRWRRRAVAVCRAGVVRRGAPDRWLPLRVPRDDRRHRPRARPPPSPR